MSYEDFLTEGRAKLEAGDTRFEDHEISMDEMCADPVHVGHDRLVKGSYALTPQSDRCGGCRVPRHALRPQFTLRFGPSDPPHLRAYLRASRSRKSRLHFVYQRKPPLCNEKLQGIQAEFAHTRSPFPRNHSQKDLGRDPQKENGEESAQRNGYRADASQDRSRCARENVLGNHGGIRRKAEIYNRRRCSDRPADHKGFLRLRHYDLSGLRNNRMVPLSLR